jgi:hypothetical protein
LLKLDSLDSAIAIQNCIPLFQLNFKVSYTDHNHDWKS